MNRLILIGNGFDLAHGLETSYKAFIHWYMQGCFKKASDGNLYEDSLIKINRNSYIFRDAEARFQWVERYLSDFSGNDLPATFRFGRHSESKGNQYYSIDLKSDLLRQLLKISSTAKWIDIEGIFYDQMILILDSNENDQARELALQKLNESMGSIINELQVYLSGIETPLKIISYDDIIYSKIDAKDIQSKPIKIRTQMNRPFETSHPTEMLMLNFNYTDTVSNYMNKRSYKTPAVTFIHGKLNDSNNPIIFGFGDEIDQRYADIENSRVLGWFEYIKSFWYLKTNNYRDLISFIDSDEYQVLVLGQSCGLSDRTMLQMIFQHDNCRSIKLYYHGNKEKNNFKQTLHEVARHFKDKGLMRRRIVSEENSERMPQFDD